METPRELMNLARTLKMQSLLKRLTVKEYIPDGPDICHPNFAAALKNPVRGAMICVLRCA